MDKPITLEEVITCSDEYLRFDRAVDRSRWHYVADNLAMWWDPDSIKTMTPDARVYVETLTRLIADILRQCQPNQKARIRWWLRDPRVLCWNDDAQLAQSGYDQIIRTFGLEDSDA